MILLRKGTNSIRGLNYVRTVTKRPSPYLMKSEKGIIALGPVPYDGREGMFLRLSKRNKSLATRKMRVRMTQGSFSKPTVTLNILSYSNTSSLLTHLTTFNTIPFKLSYILFLFLLFFILFFFNPIFTKCTWLYIPFVLIMIFINFLDIL